MPEVPHDATVALRLELGRMKDRADALEAALRKEVAAVIAEAIKDAAKSVAENDRLKQDNVRLSAQVVGLQANAVNDPSLRSAFLKAVHKDYDDIKAEVEAYRSASDEVAAAFLALPSPYNQVARVCEGIDRLKDEVERLTVAADWKTPARKIQALEAENERLRLAGDTMAQRYLSAYQIDLRNGPHTPQSVVEWNAAKEGKPSV